MRSALLITAVRLPKMPSAKATMREIIFYYIMPLHYEKIYILIEY